MMKHLIAPSLLSADFSALRQEIEMLNNSTADWVHVDLMDGVFVPNISIGFNVLESVKNLVKKPMDFHLMIQEPIRYVERCKEMGATYVTVHQEACTDLKATVEKIKSLGMKQGVVLKPDTSVEVLADTLPDYELILIMSVYPGFSGQAFIPVYDKLRTLKKMISESGSNALIEVDGGVGLDNAAQLVGAGADVLVAGNAVFKTADPAKTIEQFKKLSGIS